MSTNRSNYQIVIDLIKEISGQNGVLSIPRIFIKLTGDITVAMFLSQCVWWSDKSSRKDGGFWKSAKEWKEELELSYAQVKRATGKLEEMGILSTKVKRAKGAPTTHYYLNMEILVNLIFDFLENRESRKSENSKMDFEESRKSDFQESRKSLTALTQATTTAHTRGGDASLSPSPPRSPDRDYIADVLERAQNGGGAGIADPSQDSDQWLKYRDGALSAYHALTGLYPDARVGRPTIAKLAGAPNFDLDRWRQSIQTCRLAGVNPKNIGCMIDTYHAGGDYAAMKRNGGKKNATYRRNDSSKSVYTVANPADFD